MSDEDANRRMSAAIRQAAGRAPAPPPDDPPATDPPAAARTVNDLIRAARLRGRYVTKGAKR